MARRKFGGKTKPLPCEAGRAFVALQLMNAATSERLWFENYDYRGISAEMMARDILKYLKLIAPDAVLSRVRSGCTDR